MIGPEGVVGWVGPSSGVVAVNALLLESGGTNYLLLESGDALLLEGQLFEM